MNRRHVWPLAACAAILPVSLAAAKKPPASPVVVSDEQLYQDAMKCKVRVEALTAMPVPSRERERIASALEFWTQQERSAGARLGKADGEMMGDEVLFGFGEAAAPGGYRLANLCVKAASKKR